MASGTLLTNSNALSAGYIHTRELFTMNYPINQNLFFYTVNKVCPMADIRTKPATKEYREGFDKIFWKGRTVGEKIAATARQDLYEKVMYGQEREQDEVSQCHAAPARRRR